MATTTATSVAIIGGGPVGLVLAALLGNRGVDVTVIEKSLDVYPLPRAAHLDHTVLRVMQELGCLDLVMPSMTLNTALVLADENLDPLVRIPATGIGKSGFPASMYFYQPEFDRTLDAVAGAVPSVRVMRGVEMRSYRQDADSVVIDAHHLADGTSSTIEADWIVGCDGSWSPTREAWGVGLESLDFDERWLVLDLVLPADAPSVPDYALQVCDPSRPWVANPVPGGRYRVEVRLRDDDDIADVGDPAYLRTFLSPLLGDAQFAIERDAMYTFHGLVSTTWRVGRALIAGDAAHQMPPFLGQGMVSGIRDAYNLAWKLAGVVDGRFSEGILDTYQEEREPHSRSIIASAIEVGRFVSVSDAAAARARNAALRAGDTSTVPTFRIPDLQRGTLIRSGGGGAFPQPAHDHGYPTLDSLLGSGFSIVSVGPIDPVDLEWWQQFGVTALTLDDLGDDRDVIAAWLAKQRISVAVIRPDRCILAAGESLPEITDDVRAALTALDGNMGNFAQKVTRYNQ
jgi:3-(3-hydroxy-phenyl)propionate hydroxylase